MIKVNENRQGYKETKIGWIPDEWKMQELIELSINGINNGVFNDPNRVGSGYRLINVLDLYNEPFINTSKLSKLQLSEKEFNNKRVYWGDIFFTRSSIVLEGIAFSNINLDDSNDLTFDGHVMKITPDQDICYPPYLRFFCISNPGRKFFMRRAKLSTMTTIGQTDIKDLPVPLPSLSEQKKIVEILSTWDQVIEKLEKLIELKEKRKKGLMQQLLTGRKRLPGFKSDWETYRLKTLFKERIDIGLVNLPLLSITNKLGVILQAELNKKDSSNSDKSKYKRICIGDLGYNTMRMWQGRSALSSMEGIVSPAYTICTPSPDLSYGEFFKYLFKFANIIHLFYRHSQGLTSDTWNLKFKHFAEINVTIPHLEEQKAIAHIFHEIDKDITTQKKLIDNINIQKKGLMQKLLTGEIRVRA